MQDHSTPPFQPLKPQFPEQEQLKCPRCNSTNTKFCYYNNYNLSQPRHFCKNCKRYWTKGGSLRNIPVGGGSRKNTKRSSTSKRGNPDSNSDPTRRANEASSSSSTVTTTTTATSGSQFLGNKNSGLGDPARMYGLEADQERKMMDIGGSFSSLLESNGQYGGVFEGMTPIGSGLKSVQIGRLSGVLSSGQNHELDTRGSNNNGGGGGGEGDGGSYLQSGEWGNSNNGWPDLAIYTPSSSFQ